MVQIEEESANKVGEHLEQAKYHLGEACSAYEQMMQSGGGEMGERNGMYHGRYNGSRSMGSGRNWQTGQRMPMGGMMPNGNTVYGTWAYPMGQGGW